MSLFKEYLPVQPSSDVFGASATEEDDAIDAELAQLENEVSTTAYAGHHFGGHHFAGRRYGGIGPNSDYAFGVAAPAARGEDAPIIATSTPDQGGVDALARAFQPDLYNYRVFDWLQGMLPGALEPDWIAEARELGLALQHQASFAAWAADPTALTIDQKTDILNELFIHNMLFNNPDALEVITTGLGNAYTAWMKDHPVDALQALAGGAWSGLKTYISADLWPVLKGLVPGSTEQNVNLLAFLYRFGHAYANTVRAAIPFGKDYVERVVDYFDKYDEIIATIDAAVASGYVRPAAASSAPAPVSSLPVPGWSSPVEEIAPGTGVSGVRPATILAVGYAAVAGLALMRG